MRILRFHAATLEDQLGALEPRLRAVFAAACAERLMFPYVASTIRGGRGPATELRSILTRLWGDLCGDSMRRHEVSAKVDTCLQLISEPAETVRATQPGVLEDAGVAVMHAMQCRQHGDSHEAVSAARCAYEELLHYVGERTGMCADDALAEDRMVTSGILQAELARQTRDLEDLGSAPPADPTEVVEAIRARAQRDSRTLFDAAPIPTSVPATRAVETLIMAPVARDVSRAGVSTSSDPKAPEKASTEVTVAPPFKPTADRPEPATQPSSSGARVEASVQRKDPRPSKSKEPGRQASKRAVGESNEELLKALATELGLSRAIAILSDERSRVKRIMDA